MKRIVRVMAVLVLASVWLPACEQKKEESLFLVQSRDIGNAPPELVALCDAKAQEIDYGSVDQSVPLNAEFWSYETRAEDGLVTNEFVRQVGTAEACGFLVQTAGGSRMVVYGESEVAGLTFEGWGECSLPIQGLPTAFSLTGTCHMVLERDEAQGIAGGIATSNSVFGVATGSFWTIRVIWE
jgi:hypothetical protein